jgi:selenocysteine-specific elongation factor
MVAGASGIDLALLVVAADDGVMPQTREHVAILTLLGITRCVVAVTKTDRVDSARTQAVTSDVRALLETAALHNPPVFPVNAIDPDDAGVLALRAHLHAAALQAAPRSAERLFRLAIDRVFTLAGHGLIVAGSVCSGQLGIGDQLIILPAGHSVRVRSIHAQNQPAARGYAGQRCAVNIVGAEIAEASRGNWLVDPRACQPTARIDVRLRLLSGSPLELAAWSSVHVHLGASHQLAHIVPLQDDLIRPGEVAYAQLIFDAPVCALPGDRFIVRDAPAAHTIGGGFVLDPYAPSRRRRSPQRQQYLQALQDFVDSGSLATVLEYAPYGLTTGELARLTGFAPEHLPLPEDAMLIGVPPEKVVLLASHWQRLCARAVAALTEFHVRAPDEPGPDVGRLRRIALPDASPALWRRIVNELVRESRVCRRGPWLHLPAHTVRLSDEDQALIARLQPLIAAGRFDPPWVRTLAAAVGAPEQRVRDVLRKQALEGAVCEVVHDLFYDRQCVEELAALAADLAQAEGALTAAHYRDVVGLGRKRAIQILEYFDRVGYTRRRHETHVLRPGSGW